MKHIRPENRPRVNGGNITLTTGYSTGTSGTGGSVTITGGNPTTTMSYYGGTTDTGTTGFNNIITEKPWCPPEPKKGQIKDLVKALKHGRTKKSKTRGIGSGLQRKLDGKK
jgi:hypothetical protein